jgi:hypothetical protein
MGIWRGCKERIPRTPYGAADAPLVAARLDAGTEFIVVEFAGTVAGAVDAGRPSGAVSSTGRGLRLSNGALLEAAAAGPAAELTPRVDVGRGVPAIGVVGAAGATRGLYAIPPGVTARGSFGAAEVTGPIDVGSGLAAEPTPFARLPAVEVGGGGMIVGEDMPKPGYPDAALFTPAALGFGVP